MRSCILGTQMVVRVQLKTINLKYQQQYIMALKDEKNCSVKFLCDCMYRLLPVVSFWQILKRLMQLIICADCVSRDTFHYTRLCKAVLIYWNYRDHLKKKSICAVQGFPCHAVHRSKLYSVSVRGCPSMPCIDRISK